MNTEPESENQSGGHFHDPEVCPGHMLEATAQRAVNGAWSIRVAICPHMTAGEVLQAIRLINLSLEDSRREAVQRIAERN